MESTFLKDNTDVYDITFRSEKSIKVNIELDTDPPLDFETEQKRIQEFNGMGITSEGFNSSLKEHLTSTNIYMVKQDVMLFLRTDPHPLDIWSKDYFLQLTDMIVYK